MNTILEKLFEESELPEKDRYEIRQIYWLLSEEKQQFLIRNFDSLIEKIKKLHKSLQIEKEILVGETLQEIKVFIKKKKQK